MSIAWLNFIVSNIAMTIAVGMQLYYAYKEYHQARTAYEEYLKIEKPDREIPKEVFDVLQIAECKVTCSLYIAVALNIFPLVYYADMLRFLDPNIAYLFTYFASYFSKVFFAQMLFDAHVTIMDPHKFLLLEEKQRAAKAHLMFLRYVFHEVRVPLNSVCLGLQLLQENSLYAQAEQEVLTMMNDATTSMAATLNDVLSLQKIEEGMLELDYQPFSPMHLLLTVLHYFKAQYESKNILVTYHIDSNVPQQILGDPYRLEHVLGNLLSNAIKFSDKILVLNCIFRLMRD
jgi:signal transduction histidine kinase